MAGNRVVARYRDGRMVKGTTLDFLPTRGQFHVAPEGGGTPVAVTVADLKAVFFVKSWLGDATYNELKEFNGPVQGRKVQVEFRDGETLVGSTQGYQPDRPGFFLIPADPKSNNDRIYVVTRAVARVSLLS